MDLSDLRHRRGARRRQVSVHGLDDDHIARMVRRREWARDVPGRVRRPHRPSTWLQRAWAATLLHEPAALQCGLGAAAPRESMVLIAARRPSSCVVEPPAVGSTTRQGSGPSGTATSSASCTHSCRPTARPARDGGTDGGLAGPPERPSRGRARPTCASRGGRRLPGSDRPRRPDAGSPGAALLPSVLEDVRPGRYSALERRYLRASSAPTRSRGRAAATRETRADGQQRDVDVRRLGTVVELDGGSATRRRRDRWARSRSRPSQPAGRHLTVAARLGAGAAALPPGGACSAGARRPWLDEPTSPSAGRSAV